MKASELPPGQVIYQKGWSDGAGTTTNWSPWYTIIPGIGEVAVER